MLNMVHKAHRSQETQVAPAHELRLSGAQAPEIEIGNSAGPDAEAGHGFKSGTRFTSVTGDPDVAARVGDTTQIVESRKILLGEGRLRELTQTAPQTLSYGFEPHQEPAQTVLVFRASAA